MKCFHVHVAVDDIRQSTGFYSALFGVAPSVAKPDYAKWMLDDPRINFAISQRGAKSGVNHLGVQVDSDDKLAALQSQHSAAKLAIFDHGQATCCYAQSNKHWVTDPQEIAWEMYRTMGEANTFGGTGDDEAAPSSSAVTTSSACCTAAIAQPVQSQTKPKTTACCG